MLTDLMSYYHGLLRALRDLPETPAEEDLLYWYLAAPYHLWHEVCRYEGHSLSYYIKISGIPFARWVAKSRLAYAVGALLWPVVAFFLTLRHGRAFPQQLAFALKRPDLYLQNPAARFDERAIREAASTLFSGIYHAFAYNRSRSEAYRLDHKAVFHEACRRQGLATVPRLDPAELSDGARYVVKIPTEDMGSGVAVMTGADAKRALTGHGDLIVQPLLRNHEDLRQVVGDEAPLCTLRIVTITPDPGALAQVTHRLWRVGRHGVPVDNFAYGGTMLEVTADGTVGLGVTRQGFRERGPAAAVVAHHGDTGRQMTGTRLPCFADAVELCRRAHARLAPSAARLGWDVALTDDGPMLVEVNFSAGSIELREYDDSFARTNRAICKHLRELAAGNAHRDRVPGAESYASAC
jgi:hypothetical protein